MQITYTPANESDIDSIFHLCRQLILDYEDTETIDPERVLKWVRRKIENCIVEYTAIYLDGVKAGYYHFFRNDDGVMELDDLYIFDGFRSMGIGSEVVRRCCASANEPVMLYVFVRNERAISLYERLGFRITEEIGATRYIMVRG